MKRTTYILIGILLSGFLIMIIGIILLPCFEKMHRSNTITFGGAQVSEQLPGFKTMILVYPCAETQDHLLSLGNCHLTVSPSGGDGNTFVCPEEFRKYLELEVVNDTLKMTFNYSEKDLPADKKKAEFVYFISTEPLLLNIAQDVQVINNQMQGLELRLEGLEQDSLSLYALASVAVDSCRLGSFAVSNAYGLYLNSGEIGNLHLDLDGVRDWNVNTQNCHIDAEYLTGESNNVFLQKGECQRMYWTPKQENSELRVTLKEKSCISILD